MITSRKSSPSKYPWALPEAAGQQYDRAILLRRHGQYRAALKILIKLTKRFPNNAPLLWYTGTVYSMELNQQKLAEPYLKKAVALSPNSERASLDLFYCIHDLRGTAAAMDEMKRFVALRSSKKYDKIYLEIKKHIRKKERQRDKQGSVRMS